MKNVKIFIFFFLASLLPSLPSPAQGIPVYDAASYAQLLTQLDQMTKEYQKQIEELSEAIKQTNALTGTRNMGDLANGSLENDLRRYLPNTWKETMDMINATGLNPAGQETQQSFNRLYTAYAPIKGEDLIASAPESSTAKIFNRSTTTTLAAMSAGEELLTASQNA